MPADTTMYRGMSRLTVRPSADTGDGPHQGALRLTTRDRIEIRDVAFVAAEPLSERAREPDRVSHHRPQHRLDRLVRVPCAAARQHRATRPEIEHRNHAHASVSWRPGV